MAIYKENKQTNKNTIKPQRKTSTVLHYNWNPQLLEMGKCGALILREAPVLNCDRRLHLAGCKARTNLTEQERAITSQAVRNNQTVPSNTMPGMVRNWPWAAKTLHRPVDTPAPGEREGRSPGSSPCGDPLWTGALRIKKCNAVSENFTSMAHIPLIYKCTQLIY